MVLINQCLINSSNTTSQSNVCLPKIIYQSGSREQTWGSSLENKDSPKGEDTCLRYRRFTSTQPDALRKSTDFAACPDTHLA
uniref:Uncharacterized protein n=1 Tax=Anguilla anguilla TaxID=7936 RepID=A0A0E9TBS9_ANGAN